MLENVRVNPYELEVKVAPEYIDSYGHMNNAAYMTLFEKARWTWFRSLGYPENEIRMDGIGPVVLSAELHFRKEVREGENLRVLSKMKEFKSRIFYVQHEIYNQKKEICCRAEYSLGLFHTRSRKLVRPEGRWKDFLERNFNVIL